MKSVEKLHGLYAITDPKLTPPDSLVQQVDAALTGGARIIQLRDKSSDQALRLQLARQLRELTARHDALLIINDDAELCRAVEADGVHLGQDDMTLPEARELLGASVIIGATCHGSLALAEKAVREGADYLAFGRFFPSSTKPDAPPADLMAIGDFVRRCPLPTVAIGGITLNNAGPLLEAGFAMLAVVNDVFGRADIEAQCRRYRQLFS
ncbi:MAG TPA: thiamine phosphate synthase [Dongiaceae bacterium]|nr:thiamine phosphate synthase [Dongiaceae bacterium]